MTDDGYADDTARFYDAALDEAEMTDVGYYVERATDAEGPVLELACGTGRVYLELLRAGVDADGFDLSAGMLDRLREKAAAEGLEPTVWRASMDDFETDRAYDLAILPFNAIQHLRTVDAQRSLFESVHAALAPGGRFVFDTFVPGFDVVCEEYGEWQATTVEVDGTEFRSRTRTSIADVVEQHFVVEKEYLRDGAVVHEDRHELTMLPKQQVELLVRDSPFAEWRVEGDFEDGPIESDDRAQVWTLRRA